MTDEEKKLIFGPYVRSQNGATMIMKRKDYPLNYPQKSDYPIIYRAYKCVEVLKKFDNYEIISFTYSTLIAQYFRLIETNIKKEFPKCVISHLHQIIIFFLSVEEELTVCHFIEYNLFYFYLSMIEISFIREFLINLLNPYVNYYKISFGSYQRIWKYMKDSRFFINYIYNLTSDNPPLLFQYCSSDYKIASLTEIYNEIQIICNQHKAKEIKLQKAKNKRLSELKNGNGRNIILSQINSMIFIPLINPDGTYALTEEINKLESDIDGINKYLNTNNFFEICDESSIKVESYSPFQINPGQSINYREPFSRDSFSPPSKIKKFKMYPSLLELRLISSPIKESEVKNQINYTRDLSSSPFQSLNVLPTNPLNSERSSISQIMQASPIKKNLIKQIPSGRSHSVLRKNILNSDINQFIRASPTKNLNSTYISIKSIVDKKTSFNLPPLNVSRVKNEFESNNEAIISQTDTSSVQGIKGKRNSAISTRENLNNSLLTLRQASILSMHKFDESIISYQKLPSKALLGEDFGIKSYPYTKNPNDFVGDIEICFSHECFKQKNIKKNEEIAFPIAESFYDIIEDFLISTKNTKLTEKISPITHHNHELLEAIFEPQECETFYLILKVLLYSHLYMIISIIELLVKILPFNKRD